ncbi:Uncharacterized protein APZ42_021296, partial [Daphnia magna]
MLYSSSIPSLLTSERGRSGGGGHTALPSSNKNPSGSCSFNSVVDEDPTRAQHPRLWSESDVSRWLNWAIKEFSLEGVVLQHFRMRGRDMCAMGKENFLARTPPFMGDILWEHLEILQK